MHVKPLGAVLQKADLISTEQIEIALQRQTRAEHSKRLGEILASQGWIKQETANFFAEQWPTLLNEKQQQPLGQYLKKAFLLNEDQIKTILSEQKRTGLRFGTLVALKGWIKQTTIDFFVDSLTSNKKSQNGQVSHDLYLNNWGTPNEQDDLKRIHQGLIDNKQCPPIQLLKLYRQILQHKKIANDNRLEQLQLLELGLVVKQQNHLKVANPIYEKIFNLNWVEGELIRLQPFERFRIELFQLQKKAKSPYSLLEAILFWTDRQFFLTQKLCQLISESEIFIPAGQENWLVQQIVQNQLLENWETQVGTEFIKKIGDGLLRNQEQETIELLNLYRQILQQGEVPARDTPEEAKLLKLGLVIKQQNHLKVANRIYEKIFNLDWVEEKLIALYPFNRFGNELLNLQKNASSPLSVLEEIFFWTNTDVFLTRKLCQLISESEVFIPFGQENWLTKNIIQTNLVENWETQVGTEFIKKIGDGLLKNQQQETVQLLKLYQQILEQGEVPAHDTSEQIKLLKLGLVVKQQNHLKVANRLYERIFSLDWVETQLAKILPSSNSKIRRNPNNLRVSVIDNNKNSKKHKIKKINARLFLLLLLIPGLFLVGLNLLFKARLARNFQQGNEFLSQGKYEQAISKYDQILKMDNNSYEVWTNRGYALAGLGKYDEMLESCSAATEIDPKAIYAWNCQGEALKNLNRPELALIVFDKAIAITPKDPIFWINKSESLLSLKRFDEALETIDQAIEKLYLSEQVEGREQVKRELSVALSSKARILGEKKLDEEALAFYDQSLQYAPDYFSAQRGKGITLKNLGRYDEADANFETMLKNPKLSATQKAETWFYKGLTLCQQRRTQAGLDAFEEALKLKPDYEAANSAKINCN
jgi:tetratricopeptide (TPR) repeat protein